jgi:hypothetical protein
MVCIAADPIIAEAYIGDFEISPLDRNTSFIFFCDRHTFQDLSGAEK